MAPQPVADLGRYLAKVCASHSVRHKQPVGLLQTSDQLVAENYTYTTNNKTQEPKIPAISMIRTCDLSNQSASDLRLRPQVYHCRQCPDMFLIKLKVEIRRKVKHHAVVTYGGVQIKHHTYIYFSRRWRCVICFRLLTLMC